MRFDQPDPFDGSMDATNPQSLNRYSYVGNDPVNFTDPTGQYCQGGAVSDGHGGCVTGGGADLGQSGYSALWNGNLVFADNFIYLFWERRDAGAVVERQRPTPTQPQQQQKPKCKQDKTGGDIPDIKAKLAEAGVFGDISNIRRGLPNSPEGILFDINNRQAFVGTITSSGHFAQDIPFDHLKQVGGNAFNTNGFRSYTTDRDGLSPDSTGRRRSLQIAVGPANRDPNNPQGATGYADLDCSNPAQDVVSAIKHIFGH